MKKLLACWLVVCLLGVSGVSLAQEDQFIAPVLVEDGQPEETEAPGQVEETLAPEAENTEPPMEPTPEPEPTDVPEETPEDEDSDKAFVIGATTELSGMFFTNMWGNNTADIDVRTLIYGYSPVVWTKQSLFEINPVVVNGVSTATYEDGNKLYMISLNDDLKYSDGSPVTAQDYVFSLLLLTSPLITELGGITTNTNYLKGYEAYNAGQTDVFSGIRLVDEYTFTIEIQAAYLPFFYEMGMLDITPYPMAVIAPGCKIEDTGEGVRIVNENETVTEPVFTVALLEETILNPETGYLSNPAVTAGPYKLVDFDWDTREARFEINEHFKGMYDGALPTIDNLVFRSVVPEEMIEEYNEGKIQILNKCVAGETIDAGLELTTAGEASTETYPRLGFGFISFACEEGPFASQAVRQAVAYAIDVPQYVKSFSQYALPVYGYMGIGQWMYLSIQGGQGSPVPVETSEEEAAWAGLSLEGLNTYEMDLDKAKELLISDGWTLNEQGNPYEEGTDTVRYKLVDGELTPLAIHWGKMEDSIAGDLLAEVLPEALESIGMQIEITEVAFVDLLMHYYRQVERTYDMMYLATNFISIFDPYFVFNTKDAHQGTQNTTGIIDEELESRALNLRQTPPGAMLEYAQKWVAFQERFNEVLPMLPLYSNIYFDFFVPELQNYAPDAEMNWPVAIVYAYLDGDMPEWLAQREGMEEGEWLQDGGVPIQEEDVSLFEAP